MTTATASSGYVSFTEFVDEPPLRLYSFDSASPESEGKSRRMQPGAKATTTTYPVSKPSDSSFGLSKGFAEPVTKDQGSSAK